MMKGTLTLKSTIGKGSTFTLTLPLPQTGEIMVPPEDMPSFCEDDESADPRSDSESFLHPHTSLSDSPNVDSDSSDNKHEGGNVDTPPKLKRRETSSSSSASSSEANKHRLDLDKPLLYTRGSTGTANSKAQSIPSSSSDKKEGSSNDHTVLDDLSHLKILVAEDNMVNQEVIKRMLKLEGLTNLKMACNGAEAIDSVKESMEAGEPYDLVFMDVQMPKVDGLIATKTIRNNLHYNKPIIALTAFADESNVKECLAVGMSGFLAKPIRRTNLRKIIVEFLLSEIPAP
ncbi:Histidine protein kinase SLN1 [Candida viswanathii]|uniref:histidine kinase n=1 Tax=Candida viswanathii TaxID=5486 RepID=A0A367YND8_9ASCO|nr:Histidine protein kinase SLN1 [Candida viswanathii]